LVHYSFIIRSFFHQTDQKIDHEEKIMMEVMIK